MLYIKGILLSFYGYFRNNNEYLIKAKESSSYSSNYSFSGNQLNISPEVYYLLFDDRKEVAVGKIFFLQNKKFLKMITRKSVSLSRTISAFSDQCYKNSLLSLLVQKVINNAG